MVTKRDRFGVYECMVDDGDAAAREEFLAMLAGWGFDRGMAATFDTDQLAELVRFLSDKLGAPAAAPAAGQGGAAGGAGGMQPMAATFAELRELGKVERYFETHREQFERIGGTRAGFLLGFRNLLKLHPGSRASEYCGDPAA